MSDVLRDIVKKNAELYRDTELSRSHAEDLTHWLQNHNSAPPINIEDAVDKREYDK